MRLHVFKHLTHIGEADIGAVKRKKRGGGKGDADETCAVLFGKRHGERDAGLGRFGAVGIDENILKPHAHLLATILSPWTSDHERLNAPRH